MGVGVGLVVVGLVAALGRVLAVDEESRSSALQRCVSGRLRVWQGLGARISTRKTTLTERANPMSRAAISWIRSFASVTDGFALRP